jgi:hypothetical protein
MTNFLRPSSPAEPMGALVSKQEATKRPDSSSGLGVANLQARQACWPAYDVHACNDGRLWHRASAPVHAQGAGPHLSLLVLCVTVSFDITLKERHSLGSSAPFEAGASSSRAVCSIKTGHTDKRLMELTVNLSGSSHE